jgi:hypothetical protein
MKLGPTILLFVLISFSYASARPASSTIEAHTWQRQWTREDHGAFVHELDFHLPTLNLVTEMDFAAHEDYLETLSPNEGTVPQIAARQLLVQAFNDPLSIPLGVGAALARKTDLDGVGRVVSGIVHMRNSVEIARKKAIRPSQRDLALLQKFLQNPAKQRPGVYEMYWNDLFDGAEKLNERIAGAKSGAMTDLILENAQAKGISHRSLANAIQGSRNLQEAVDHIKTLGILPDEEEIRPGINLALDIWLILQFHNLWSRVASHAEPAYVWDETWAIPALVARIEGRIIYVHGHPHGEFGWSKWLIRELVESLQSKGKALYWEQKIPAVYGETYGKEFLDHLVSRRKMIQIIPARGARKELPPTLTSHLAERVKNFVDLLKWLENDKNFEDDIAAGTLLRGAKNALEPTINPAEYLGRFLPTPLKIFVYESGILSPTYLSSLYAPSFLERSRAMAAASLEDAILLGLEEAHILCGGGHAAEIAWMLMHPDEKFNQYREAFRASRAIP